METETETLKDDLHREFEDNIRLRERVYELLAQQEELLARQEITPPTIDEIKAAARMIESSVQSWFNRGGAWDTEQAAQFILGAFVDGRAAGVAH